VGLIYDPESNEYVPKDKLTKTNGGA